MKTGDLVLVRTNPYSRWELSIYAYTLPVSPMNDCIRYRCINGVEWMECIPYKGNESLLGTRGTCASDFSAGQPVAVRNYPDEEWKVRHFSHLSEDGDGFVCTKGYPSEDGEMPSIRDSKPEAWKCCVPMENAFAGFGRIYERRDKS